MARETEWPGRQVRGELDGLGFFRGGGAGGIRSENVDGLYTVHTVVKDGRTAGTVLTYDAGLARSGLKLPFDVESLVGDEGASLLTRLSRDRLGGAGAPLGGSRASRATGYAIRPDPEHFRRHQLAYRDVRDRLVLVDLKIPGRDGGHLILEPANFTAAARIHHMFVEEGSEPPMACPYFMARIPGAYGTRLYGENEPRQGTQNIIGLEHLEGIRWNVNGMDGEGVGGLQPENVVRHIAGKAGKPPAKVVLEAGDTMMRLLSKAHEAGLSVGSDLHWGNYSLQPEGGTKSVSDLGSAEKAATQSLALDRRMAASMYLKLAARYRGIIEEGGEPARPLRHYGHDRAAMEAVFENLRQGLRRHSNERLLLAYDVLDV